MRDSLLQAKETFSQRERENKGRVRERRKDGNEGKEGKKKKERRRDASAFNLRSCQVRSSFSWATFFPTFSSHFLLNLFLRASSSLNYRLSLSLSFLLSHFVPSSICSLPPILFRSFFECTSSLLSFVCSKNFLLSSPFNPMSIRFLLYTTFLPTIFLLFFPTPLDTGFFFTHLRDRNTKEKSRERKKREKFESKTEESFVTNLCQKLKVAKSEVGLFE